ncbi:MAG: Appr-1-p processing protein [Cyanothece sp. SIO1E1]|nr:Appr-1-p processing protein [Cyanothece sp. SIO1E1]
MQIILTALQPSLAKAWTTCCDDLDFVKIHQGSILDVECDAVVSPANSFGFMDGGIDAIYMDYFGREIQLKVRRQIFDHHHGELLVGAATIVETSNDHIPFLIAAPTMRVPMFLSESVNPYLAARAVLLLVKHGRFQVGQYKDQLISNYVQVVAFPGLGTGVGRVNSNTCARQVRAAIDDIVLERYKMPKSWAEASERHQLLYA